MTGLISGLATATVIVVLVVCFLSLCAPTPVAELPVSALVEQPGVDELHEAWVLGWRSACERYGGVSSVCVEGAEYFADEQARKGL